MQSRGFADTQASIPSGTAAAAPGAQRLIAACGAVKELPGCFAIRVEPGDPLPISGERILLRHAVA